MNTRTLGKTGYTVSEIGLGRGPQFEGMARYTKERVKDSLAGSIKRLGVDTLDLAQLHCIPIDVLRDGEIFTWLDDLRDAGMIRHWGASVQTIEEGTLAMRSDGCTALQTIFNLFRQDAIDDLFPAAQKANVGIIVRLPLASGLLSGKMRKDTEFTAQDHRNFNRDGQAFYVGETFSGLPFETGVKFADQLKQMAPKGMTLAHLALRWILDQPAVSTIIAGVTRPEQLKDNAGVSRMDPLPASLVEEVKAFYLDKVRPEVRGGI